MQIADALQAAEAGGSLKPGDRLPPQRLLAAQLDVDWSSAQFARAADSEGITVTPAEAFATGAVTLHAIRISLGNIKNRERLRTGLQRLSHLLARPETSSAAVV